MEDAENDIDFDFDVFLPSIGKNLQRPFVWSLFQKQQLIHTVLKENTIGNISVIKLYKPYLLITEKLRYQVIDGKQRLSTLLGFVKDEFPLEWNGKNYLYSELADSDMYCINCINLKFNVVIDREKNPITDEQKINWFEMINFAGTPQDMQYMEKLKIK